MSIFEGKWAVTRVGLIVQYLGDKFDDIRITPFSEHEMRFECFENGESKCRWIVDKETGRVSGAWDPDYLLDGYDELRRRKMRERQR